MRSAVRGCGCLGNAWFALVATIANGQTSGRQSLPSAPSDRTPNVIDSCIDQGPQSKTKICTNWARVGDGKFVNLSNSTQLAIEQFGGAGVVISSKQANAPMTETYRGKIVGNRIEGTLEYTYAGVQSARPAVLPWSASYFYSPTENPATGRRVYAACEAEVSVINTADHSVSSVKVEAKGHSVAAIAVSPDSSTAYISSDGESFRPATIWVVNGVTGAVTRSFNSKDSPTPSGLSSLAVSGDGSTVYGFGWDRKHLWSTLVALDANSGAAKASVAVPQGNHAQRFLLAGSKVVLDSGTVVDLPVPSGAPPVFSNGNGLSAFPDGARICSGQSILAVGTGVVLRRVPGCGPVSPDGTKIYVNGAGFVGVRTLPALPPTKLDPEESITVVVGGALGLAADGKTVFALDGGTAPDGSAARTGHATVYTFDLQAAWTNARQRILWNADFGQAAAGQERQALLTQKKD